MKILIDIDPNLYTRLYDNGTELSEEDVGALATTVRNGDVVEDYWVDHGQKDMLLRNCIEVM